MVGVEDMVVRLSLWGELLRRHVIPAEWWPDLTVIAGAVALAGLVLAFWGARVDTDRPVSPGASASAPVWALVWVPPAPLVLAPASAPVWGLVWVPPPPLVLAPASAPVWAPVPDPVSTVTWAPTIRCTPSCRARWCARTMP